MQKSQQCQGVPAFQHGDGTTLEILWPHRTQCSWWRPSPCSRCCDMQASITLETTSRKTQPHVAQSHWIGSETTEHRSFLCVEEGSLSRTLAFDCGHDYAQEQCAMKKAPSLHRTTYLSHLLLMKTTTALCKPPSDWKQPRGRPNIRLWTRLHSQRVCHEETVRERRSTNCHIPVDRWHRQQQRRAVNLLRVAAVDDWQSAVQTPSTSDAPVTLTSSQQQQQQHAPKIPVYFEEL